MRYAWYHAIRFEHKAASQLEKSLAYIKANFDAVKSIPELKIDCDLGKPKICPLVVSNIFEIDDHLIAGQYPKVSLFELTVILNNELYETLRSPWVREGANSSISSVLQSFNRNASGFKASDFKPVSSASCNLWSDPEGCSPRDLIDAINDKRMWQELDEMMEFSFGGPLTIGAFDKEKRVWDYQGH